MTSRSKLQSGQAIAQAMLAVCLAVAAHAAFPGVLGSRWPFAPFVLAVLASCKWGGLGLGLFIAAGMFVSAQKSAKRPQAAPVQRTSLESPMPMFEYADPSGPRRMAA
jgi:hypothetical protein